MTSPLSLERTELSADLAFRTQLRSRIDTNSSEEEITQRVVQEMIAIREKLLKVHSEEISKCESEIQRLSKLSLNEEQKLELELLKQKLARQKEADVREEGEFLALENFETKIKRQIKFLREWQKNSSDTKEPFEIREGYFS